MDIATGHQLVKILHVLDHAFASFLQHVEHHKNVLGEVEEEEVLIELRLRLLSISNLGFALSQPQLLCLVPLDVCITMKSYCYKLRLLIFGDVLILKKLFHGTKPIQELLRLQKTMEL